MSIQNVVLIGGGVLGSQIAYQTAYKGFHVTIWLRSDASIGRAQPKLQRLHDIYVAELTAAKSSPGPYSAGLLENGRTYTAEEIDARIAQAEAALQEMKLTTDLADAVKDADLVMVLAVIDETGLPYCMPLNGVRVGESVYFHSARRGEKLDCLRLHPQVCLTAVGRQRVVQQAYETEFTSAVARGTAHQVDDPEEQKEALRAICKKYAPDCPDRVEEVIEKYLPNTAVWRVVLDSVSGREKICQNA